MIVSQEAQEQQQRVTQAAHGTTINSQGVQLQHLTTGTGATAIIVSNNVFSLLFFVY